MPAALIAPSPEILLTMKEVAGRLRVSDRTVYAVIRRGELRACRVGRASVRVTPAELDRYIASRMAQPIAAA